jgi:hypothetical protein
MQKRQEAHRALRLGPRRQLPRDLHDSEEHRVAAPGGARPEPAIEGLDGPGRVAGAGGGHREEIERVGVVGLAAAHLLEMTHGGGDVIALQRHLAQRDQRLDIRGHAGQARVRPALGHVQVPGPERPVANTIGRVAADGAPAEVVSVRARGLRVVGPQIVEERAERRRTARTPAGSGASRRTPTRA